MSTDLIALPEMPLPRAVRAGHSFPKVYATAYTADQMQEYARASVAAALSSKEAGPSEEIRNVLSAIVNSVPFGHSHSELMHRAQAVLAATQTPMSPASTQGADVSMDRQSGDMIESTPKPGGLP